MVKASHLDFRRCSRLDTGQAARWDRAFTLIELLVVVVIIGILVSMLLPALARSKTAAVSAQCAGNQHQLGIAAQMYWDDNSGYCFPIGGAATNGGQLWWFGWLGSGAEGERSFDLSQGVLFPYLRGSNVRLCPALGYALAGFKLKADGVVFSYGYNSFLSPVPGQARVSAGKIVRPAEIALFADSAQVNDFQAPASRANPMLEEWYFLDNPSNSPGPNYYPHVHFRHSRRAAVAFCDGHVAFKKFLPGSIDPKLPDQLVARLSPGNLLNP